MKNRGMELEMLF